MGRMLDSNNEEDLDYAVKKLWLHKKTTEQLAFFLLVVQYELKKRGFEENVR